MQNGEITTVSLSVRQMLIFMDWLSVSTKLLSLSRSGWENWGASNGRIYEPPLIWRVNPSNSCLTKQAKTPRIKQNQQTRQLAQPTNKTNHYELSRNTQKPLRGLREQGVGGSNPPTPTIVSPCERISCKDFFIIDSKSVLLPLDGVVENESSNKYYLKIPGCCAGKNASSKRNI
jgi:hypothetical protein